MCVFCTKLDHPRHGVSSDRVITLVFLSVGDHGSTRKGKGVCIGLNILPNFDPFFVGVHCSCFVMVAKHKTTLPRLPNWRPIEILRSYRNTLYVTLYPIVCLGFYLEQLYLRGADIFFMSCFHSTNVSFLWKPTFPRPLLGFLPDTADSLNG